MIEPSISMLIDAHVGARIRQRRKVLGLSQQQLAEAMGLSPQQIRHYENGTLVFDVDALWVFAEVLDVPIAYLFEEMAPELANIFPPTLH